MENFETKMILLYFSIIVVTFIPVKGGFSVVICRTSGKENIFLERDGFHLFYYQEPPPQ